MNKQKRIWRGLIMVLFIVVPGVTVIGGVSGLMYSSRRNFQIAATRLGSTLKRQREEGQSKRQIAVYEQQLEALGSRKIVGFPASWLASYDGVDRQLSQLQGRAQQSYTALANKRQRQAQDALEALETAMGKFAEPEHRARLQALKQAATPRQYAELAASWTKSRTTWLAATTKLKATSGGYDDGQPADILHLQVELKKLLQHPPKAKITESAQDTMKQIAAYMQASPPKQLLTHAALKQKLQTIIQKVKRAKALVYREQSGTNPFGNVFVSYLHSRQSQVSVAVYDARNGRTYVFQPNLDYGTASIVKATIMADLLHQAEVTGKPLTATENSLMQPMIEESDNHAASALWNLAGQGPGMNGFLHLAGLSHTMPGPGGYWGLTSTTVRDQVDLMKLYAFPNKVLNDQARQYGLNLMEHVVSWEDWGVSTGASGHATVALKNGWSPEASDDWRINSIGYIVGDGRDYVIAVLSQHNPTENYGIQTVDEVSQLVWEALG